ncbi:MAG: Trm112 family protein [Candidatus Aenigmarchaeota archaeon]|nr:Trm112 family protein [Candidatus Aenigmarchaeota archaeon]
MVDKELLAILACPKCKGDVNLEKQFITCKACSLAFPVLDDVPDMLLDDAWPLDKAKKAGFAHDLHL